MCLVKGNNTTQKYLKGTISRASLTPNFYLISQFVITVYIFEYGYDFAEIIGLNARPLEAIDTLALIIEERKMVGGDASSLKLNLTDPCRTVPCQYNS